jgi:hypothetical protein
MNKRGVEWFLQPFIPRGMLSMVVGAAGSGKSTFLAHLMSKARNTIMLPGFEEDFEVMTLPRLEVCGVDLARVHVLDRGDWTLPACHARLVNEVKRWDADLVVIDPISSYLDEMASENDARAVRTALEAVSRVARETRAACVAVRHPGKGSGNVMVGSREWRAVPRSIVELLMDSGPTPSRMIQLHKDSLGQGTMPRRFDLVGEPGQPRRFEIGDLVAESEVYLAQEVPDRLERGKVDRACDLIRCLLADGEMLAKEVYRRAEEEKLSDRTMDRAAAKLEIVRRREGQGADHRSYWSLPGSERE